MAHSHLTDAERLEIGILLGKGYSCRDIGSALGRSHASISRELRRNRTLGGYQPRSAKMKARMRRRQSKYQGMKVRERPDVEGYIVAKLKLYWTPEQIAGRLKYVDTHLPYISGKGIYKWLYSAWGQAYCHLLPKKRHKPARRRKKKTRREMIPNRISFHYRPVEADRRIEHGHFEEDTMVSGRRTKSKVALAVFCERKARYSRLSRMKNMRPEIHVRAQQKMAKGLKMETVTYDNGIENKQHEKVAHLLEVRTFFCDPYASWQKGMVENTIGRIRRFIPKGADIGQFSHRQIAGIECWLNHTPRKCLNFKTPHEIMSENLRFISPSPSGAFEG